MLIVVTWVLVVVLMLLSALLVWTLSYLLLFHDDNVVCIVYVGVVDYIDVVAIA